MATFFYKGLIINPELKTPPSEFSPISRDWAELQLPNLVRMFLIKCYRTLQSVSVTAFTVSRLLRLNQQRNFIELGLKKFST